jgi:hypothetical protein
MNKQEKEEKKLQLTSEVEAKVAFLQSQIDQLILDCNVEVKKRQDEIDALTIQVDALKEFKIK